jgi:hypothetical protein
MDLYRDCPENTYTAYNGPCALWDCELLLGLYFKSKQSNKQGPVNVPGSGCNLQQIISGRWNKNQAGVFEKQSLSAEKCGQVSVQFGHF